MKKSALILVLLLAAATFKTTAQSYALGLRASVMNYNRYDDRCRAEVSFQTGQLFQNGRLEADFGWGRREVLQPDQTTYLTEHFTNYALTYQWRHKFLWKLYYFGGLGGSAYLSGGDIDILGVNAQLGLELDLKIPLQITADYRPMFDLLDGLTYYHSCALGVRYTFPTKQKEPEYKGIKKLIHNIKKD